MEVVGGVASVIAIIQLTGQIAKLCREYIGDAKNADSDQLAILFRVQSLGSLLAEVEGLIHGPHQQKFVTSASLQEALFKCKAILESLERDLQPQGTSRFKKYIRKLKWPLRKEEVERMIGILNSMEESIRFAIQLDEVKMVLAIDEKIDKIAVAVEPIAGLPVAEAAVFGSFADQHEPVCLSDTREQLLGDFQAWVTAPRQDVKPIFWLCGAAGTGKSTIARTIATTLTHNNMLAASFFFKRGGGDRGNASKFITTLATGFCAHWPSLRKSIQSIVRKDESIATKGMRQQFEELIFKPLSSIPGSQNVTSRSAIIVIDALDECENEDDVRLLMQVLARLKELENVDIRILITSRPETPIRAGFKKIAGAYIDLVLHDIEEKTIKHDLSRFLHDEFSKMVEEHDDVLSPSWPGDTVIQQLVDLSSPLFIVAATICRLMNDSYFGPKLQLQKILEYQAVSNISKLGRTYLPIFDQLIVGRDEFEKAAIVESFKETVGTILILESPLSLTYLSQLVDVDEDYIRYRLNGFHSVLYIPKNPLDVIRPFHLSFKEFIFDPSTRNESRFCLDKTALHQVIGRKCIALLDKKLKQNICELSPFVDYKEQATKDAVEKYLTPDIQYACKYWVFHIVDGQEKHQDNSHVHRFLKKHFLHWIEALGLANLGASASVIVDSISELERIVTLRDAPELSSLIRDMRQFVRVHYPLEANHEPLEIYTRAILETPEKSIVRRLFFEEQDSKITQSQISALDDFWGLSVLRQYIGQIEREGCGLQFSSDSTHLLIPSKSVNMLNFLNLLSEDDLSDLKTFYFNGKHKISLVKDGGEGFRSAIPSPDAKFGLFVTNKREVSIASLETGDFIRDLNIPEDSELSAGFSENGDLVVAYRRPSKSIFIGRCARGVGPLELQHILECDSTDIQLLLSPNNNLLAVLSEEKVQFWNVESGILFKVILRQVKQTPVLLGQKSIFSVDSKLWAERDGPEVTILEVASGKLLQTFTATGVSSRSNIREIAFCPIYGQLFAITAYGDFYLWDITPGNLLLSGSLETALDSASFSPDGKLLALLNSYGRLEFWDTRAMRLSISTSGSALPDRTINFKSRDRPPRIHTKAMKTDLCLFSPDGRYLVSPDPVSRCINTWDLIEPVLKPRKLKTRDHAHNIDSLAFSPDCGFLAIAKNLTWVGVWDVDSGKALSYWDALADSPDPRRRIMDLTFSPDSTKLVAAVAEEGISCRTWDWKCPSPADSACDFSDLPGGGQSVLFSPDGVWLACVSQPLGIILYDLSLGTSLLVQLQSPNSGRWKAIDFSSDSQSVVWVDEDQFSPEIEIYVWSIPSKSFTKRACLWGPSLFWNFSTYRRQNKLCNKEGILGLREWADSDDHEPIFEPLISCFDEQLQLGCGVVFTRSDYYDPGRYLIHFNGNTISWVSRSGYIGSMAIDLDQL